MQRTAFQYSLRHVYAKALAYNCDSSPARRMRRHVSTITCMRCAGACYRQAQGTETI